MKDLRFYKDLQDKMVSLAVYANYLVVFQVYPEPLPFARSGLTINDCIVVWNLDRKGPQKMSDLATANNFKPYQMSRIVEKLVASGYIKRYKRNGNHKSLYLELTEEGKRFAAENFAEQVSRLKENLESVSNTCDIKKFCDSYDYLINLYEKFSK